MAQSGAFEALVALGAVIRGETYHFEIVPTSRPRGVAEVQLEFGIPVGNGILTTDTDEQALVRCEKGLRGGAGGARARQPAGSHRCGLARGARAREFVLQGLYQRQLSGNASAAIRDQVAGAAGFPKADETYFDALWAG